MFTEFILYVSDLDKSKNFYSTVFNQSPVLDVPGMVEFELNENSKLGLMPENGIAKIICPPLQHPSLAMGIPKCELYLKTAKCHELFQNSVKAGALIISKPLPRDWGDEVSYVADPDGHIIAFAKSMSKV